MYIEWEPKFCTSLWANIAQEKIRMKRKHSLEILYWSVIFLKLWMVKLSSFKILSSLVFSLIIIQIDSSANPSMCLFDLASPVTETFSNVRFTYFQNFSSDLWRHSIDKIISLLEFLNRETGNERKFQFNSHNFINEITKLVILFEYIETHKVFPTLDK